MSKERLPIDSLIKHLKQHKDAVIVLGSKIITDEMFRVDEKTKEIYNRKTMIKEPDKFWKFYSKCIMSMPEHYSNNVIESINELLKLNLHSHIIDINLINSVDNVISPNGRTGVLECVKCHKQIDAYDIQDQLENQEKVFKCECGGNIKPTVLYFGEKYTTPVYNSVKDAIFTEKNDKPILNTHTLIFIGVDFMDSLTEEIIDSFDALKTKDQFTVIIDNTQTNLLYYEPEFGVSDELDKGINRLIELLK